MKEMHSFCKSLTLKGGVMYKKVLAFLLVCFFGISNICGAATLASFNPVDNMALKSFLDNESPDQDMRDNFVTMLEIFAERKYSESEVAEINALWDAGDKKGALQDFLNRKMSANWKIDDATGEISLKGKVIGNINVTEEDQLIVQEARAELAVILQNIGQGSATIGRYLNEDGTQNDEGLHSMANDLHATGRALTSDEAAKVENWINDWEANVNKASLTAEERASEEAAIADARAKLNNGRFFIGKAQVASDTRYVLEAHEGIGSATGRITIAEEWLTADDAVGADMISHAFRPENGQEGHEASLAENALQEKVSSRATMAQTAAKANEIINAGVAKEKTAAEQVAAVVDAEKLSKGGEEALKEADAVKEKLAEKPEFSQLSAVETSQVVTILNNIIDNYKTEATTLEIAMNQAATKEVDNAALETSINKLEEGQKIGFYMSTLVQKYKGTWVGTFPGTKILQRLEEIASKEGSKLKAGSLNIIGTGAERAAIEADLARQYPNLFGKGIAKVHATTERDLLADGTFIKGSTTVAFYDEVKIAVEGIDYVPVTDIQRTNGLKLLAQVLAPRGEKISGAEQAILADIQDGKLQTPDLTVADEGEYKMMFDKYLQVIELRTKA